MQTRAGDVLVEPGGFLRNNLLLPAFPSLTLPTPKVCVAGFGLRILPFDKFTKVGIQTPALSLAGACRAKQASANITLVFISYFFP